MNKQVGDVNSTAKGSGARYNAGKAPLELVPFSILEIVAKDKFLQDFLSKMNLYQFTGDVGFLEGCVLQLEAYIPDCAHVFEYGRKKYSEWNWLKGMAWSIPLACIGRHAMKINNGEELDIESGQSHWGHIMCNLVMLITYAEVFPEGNDLPKKPESE